MPGSREDGKRNMMVPRMLAVMPWGEADSIDINVGSHCTPLLNIESPACDAHLPGSRWIPL